MPVFPMFITSVFLYITKDANGKEKNTEFF